MTWLQINNTQTKDWDQVTGGVISAIPNSIAEYSMGEAPFSVTFIELPSPIVAWGSVNNSNNNTWSNINNT